MPLSLKTTVTRQAADAQDLQPADEAQEGTNEAATDAAALAPVPKAKVNPHALQSAFLSANLNRSIAVYLINGIRLAGKLRQYDTFCLLLEGPDGANQLIFKSAISTIMPPARRPQGDTHGNKCSSRSRRNAHPHRTNLVVLPPGIPHPGRRADRQSANAGTA